MYAEDDCLSVCSSLQIATLLLYNVCDDGDGGNGGGDGSSSVLRNYRSFCMYACMVCVMCVNVCACL